MSTYTEDPKRDLLIELTNSYYEYYRTKRPNLSKDELYAECREEAADDLRKVIKQELLNFAAQLRSEFVKRDLSSDAMPKGARKMTNEELIAYTLTNYKGAKVDSLSAEHQTSQRTRPSHD